MSWLLSPAADTIEIGDLKDVVITGAVKGDIIAFDGTDWVDLTVGTNGEVLTADSAVTEGVKWAAVSASEINDLTAAVTWANVPDANITQSSVTQHEAALTIFETQITDGALLARLAEVETITANWAFEGNIDIRDGNSLSIRDATNADRIVISHDGVDLVIGHTGTTDWNITGIAGLNVVNYNFDVDQTVGAGQDNFILTYDDASGLISLEAAAGGGGDKVYRIGHTYGILRKVKVPSGQKDFIIPFFVSFASGQTAKLVKARHIINTGTSVTCKLQKNGSDITGFTGMSVTTTATDTDPADVTLANDDKLALVVTAVSGTPENMSFTIFIEYTQ